jgi:hypothetical protein
MNQERMSRETQTASGLKDSPLESMLRRALRNTLILGLIPSLILWIASGWRNAAMLATGTAISALSILEWRRLTRILSARLDGNQAPRGALVAGLFFVLRLIVFAAAIYGSLKFLRGSAVALLCGLGLAVVSLGWEALRLLRDW